MSLDLRGTKETKMGIYKEKMNTIMTEASLKVAYIANNLDPDQTTTVVPAKSDSDIIFCLQLLCKTFTCTLHLS